MQNSTWGPELRKSFNSPSAVFPKPGIDLSSKTNILVDKYCHARLTDFGLTSVTRGENSLRSPQDPPAANTAWAAPEVLRDGVATKEGDIFTFAMVSVEARTSRTSASASQLTYL